MKAKLVFITISTDTGSKVYDYPQNIPLPRTGDSILFNIEGSIWGIVTEIRHIVTGDVVEVRIIVKPK